MILTIKTFTVAWGRKTGKETLMMQQEMGCKQGRVKFRTFHTEFVSDPLGM